MKTLAFQPFCEKRPQITLSLPYNLAILLEKHLPTFSVKPSKIIKPAAYRCYRHCFKSTPLRLCPRTVVASGYESPWVPMVPGRESSRTRVSNKTGINPASRIAKAAGALSSKRPKDADVYV